jgi:hypothetical protein
MLCYIWTVQEVEDRKRIQHLLALTQPVSQEVTYIRECRPDKITRNYVKEEMAHANAARGISMLSCYAMQCIHFTSLHHRYLNMRYVHQIGAARSSTTGTTSSNAITSTDSLPSSGRTDRPTTR